MNETEKRLRIYRALTTNPEWFEVHANPQTLKKMVTSKLLNITFSSHSATHYKVADPELVREAIQAVSEPAPNQSMRCRPTYSIPLSATPM